MISPRLRLAFTLISAALIAELPAQQSPGTGSAPVGNTSSGSGTSSPFGSPPPSPAAGSTFGVPPGSSAGFGGTGTSLSPGAASSSAPAGSVESAGPLKPLDSGPTTFSISTGYGKAPELFTSGEGRLARPKFKTSVSASIGFDDNIFQTPTNAKGTPQVVIQQQVTLGTEEQIILVPIPDNRPVPIDGTPRTPRPQQYREVIIPAVEPEFQEIVIPGTPKAKRRVSAISRESLSFEAQTATRRTVFTFDLNVNTDYYWNRPGKKSEYNGDLAIRYLHRFTPRLQVTSSLNASYLSQPDLSQINTPTNTGNGNYLVLASKSDISYRWTPRFSTVGSLNFNSLNYEEKVRQIGDYSNIAVGLELRYLWKPKVTGVVEGRYGHISYSNNPALDSTSYFALVGLDLSLSRRAAATIRIGEGIRTFDESGESGAAPFLETTLNYQLSKASVLSWNNRFGFEEPPDPNTEVLTFRTGLSVTHVFGPRLRGSLSLNGIHRTSTNDLAQTEATEDTLDSALNFYYTLTRKWSFNLSYNYTAVFFDPTDNDYFRNRVTAGFDYAF